MCFKTPKIPPVQKAPTREDATKKAAVEERRVATEQQGVVGNIFTSALGDTSFGQNAQKLATLGGSAAPRAA